ncbi:MAG TPA: hypothetical protein VE291_09520 [Terracidiphilus sp.]|nr:hypothetical protein [Terracidiphilus sp.]
MLLDLTRALSFFGSIVALYAAAINAFFVPGTRIQDRIVLALLHLGFAACVCLVSGIFFAWPQPSQSAHAHAQRTPIALASTLPVRMFLWSLAAIALLFFASWYLASYPCGLDPTRDCNL